MPRRDAKAPKSPASTKHGDAGRASWLFVFTGVNDAGGMRPATIFCVIPTPSANTVKLGAQPPPRIVPLNAVGLATIPRASMGNATALLNVVRNLGGGMGVAVVSTLLSRRAQEHQSTLISHVNQFDPETVARLSAWAEHFERRGADSFTAERRAMATIYQEVTRQAQVLAFADDFWMLFVLFCGTLVLLPLLSRVRTPQVTGDRARADDAPAPVHME